MPFILRSKNRPDFEQYEPESISAWSEQPDVSLAPTEAWEEVQDLEQVLRDAPVFQTKEHQPLSEPVEAPVNPPVEGEGEPNHA